jgi:hypothetical protein
MMLGLEVQSRRQNCGFPNANDNGRPDFPWHAVDALQECLGLDRRARECSRAYLAFAAHKIWWRRAWKLARELDDGSHRAGARRQWLSPLTSVPNLMLGSRF